MDSIKLKEDLVLTNSSHKNDRYLSRRTLSQIYVAGVVSLLFLDLGMILVAPTIIIGELHNTKDGLSLDDNQASWLGSISLLCQPLSSVVSGCLQNSLGRKRSMMIVSLTHMAGWLFMHSAKSLATLYTAAIIMGIGIGFQEAPILAYIGEVSEPHLRGTLAVFVNSTVVLGFLVAFILGYLLHWRLAMLISSMVPMATAVFILMIPESPIWLLTKGRKDEAITSLKWLRGWVSDDEVNDEFQSLDLYCQASNNEFKNDWETKIKESSYHTGVPDGEYVMKKELSVIDGIWDFLRPEILKPLKLVCMYFFFAHAASLEAMRPFMIKVFKKLELPSPNALTIAFALIQVVGSLVCISLVRLVGKRPLSLISMGSCAMCCLSLSTYTYVINYYSSEPLIPLFLFCFLYLSFSLGVNSIPWLLISEVFPTRGRGLAGGVCAAIYYLFAFSISKTWLNLEHLVELQGCFFIYGIISCIGVLYLFFFLPETEGKTLAEIEKQFTKKTIK